MKSNILILSILSAASLLFFNSCATQQSGVFRDDVYHQRAEAVERPYQDPEYFYDTEAQEYTSADGYYEDEYADGAYYADEYTDSEYARRFDRFYYYAPGMSYFDPFYDPWYGGFNSFGYYDPWAFGAGFYMGYSWGFGSFSPYYYRPHYPWGLYPY